jgi:hypothetical protein
VVSAVSFWILDFSALVTSINWVFRGTNSRPILNLLLFFAFRRVCNWSFLLKDHDHMRWDDSNVFSFFISYSKSKNSFFSAVIGIYVICALELHDNNLKITSMLTLLGMASYFALSLALRSEYFISLLCGIAAAHYFHIIANKYHINLENHKNLSVRQPIIKVSDSKTRDYHKKKLREDYEAFPSVEFLFLYNKYTNDKFDNN